MMDVFAPGDSDQAKGSVMMSRELEASCHEGNPLAQHYYILDTLDEGSFAQVKLAVHLMTQTIVAIKILKRDTSTDFLVNSEIDIMTSLMHSNIIGLFEIINTRHETYLVMEYAARGSLRKHINNCGRLDEEEARSIFRELSLAINYIHSQNIAHRDIKAENILLDKEGHVKLSDFGLGKRLAPGEKLKGFCGTPQYCAPEVFGIKKYDVLRTDIWSVGILLYYLVVGHLPFTETVISKLKHQIVSMSCWIPYRLSPELRDLLTRLTAIDPTMRPSIKDVLVHPWLRHYQDILKSPEEIPTEPEPNIAFAMFLMGFNIKELRDALREQKYCSVMATYLIIKKKSNCQPQLYQEEGQGDTQDPTKASSLPSLLRRVSSAPSLSTFSLHTLNELPADGSKSCKRRHSVPPTLSSHDWSFLENTSPLEFSEKEGSSNYTTSSSGKRKTTTTTTTTTTTEATKVTSRTSGTAGSLFTSSQSSNLENTQDVTNEISESTDTNCRSSAWGSTTSSPFSSEKFQEENTPTEWLQDSSSSSRETDHQEQLQRQSQPGPRMPLRTRAWRSLKNGVSRAFRSLCCCLPVANTKVIPVNEERVRDTGCDNTIRGPVVLEDDTREWRGTC